MSHKGSGQNGVEAAAPGGGVMVAFVDHHQVESCGVRVGGTPGIGAAVVAGGSTMALAHMLLYVELVCRDFLGFDFRV